MVRKRHWIWAPLVVSLAFGLGATPAAAGGQPVAVSIQSPATGATVFGSITVSGTAFSKFGLRSVGVAVDSGAFQAATLSGSGWTYPLDTNTLTNGTHNFTAKATDNHGNTAATTVTVSANNTPPSITITAPRAGALIVGTFTVSGTASSPAAGVATINVRVDSNPATLATGTTSWSTSLNTAGYADGAHTVFATATDTAGHATTTSVSVTFSNSPPSIAITSPHAGAVLVATVTVSGTASSPAGVSSVQVRVDSGASTSSPNTANWAVSIDSTAFSDGAHTIFATATDSFGRTSTASVVVTISNSPPSVSISSPSAGAVVSGTVAVSGSASSAAGIASVSVQVDSTAAVAATGTTSWSHSIDTTALPDGNHTVTATATDSLGRSTSTTVSVTVSNAPPAITIQSPTSGATISSTYTIAGYASSIAGITTVQVQVDSNTPITASGTQSWSLTIDTTTLTPGAHTITATATDSLGRSTSTSVAVTVSTLIQTHQAPWYGMDSTGNVSTVNETMAWDGSGNQGSKLPTGTITFQVNSTLMPNDANPADTCTQDPTTGFWSCVHTLTSADLQWAPYAGGWSVHYAFTLQVEYPPTSTFTISYSGDANFAASSAVAANT